MRAEPAAEEIKQTVTHSPILLDSTKRVFKETELGLLPDDWAVSCIAESCYKPEYGYTASAEQEPVGPRFLRITDIQEQGVNWDSVPYCRCDEATKRKHWLQPGDLLFARIGATTGKSFLVRRCPDAVYASYLIRVRAKTVDPAFLYYFCNSEMYWRQINASKGDKLKGGVSGSVLAQVRHCLPPLPEQHAIAAVLSQIQAAVEVQDKIVATLKALKAATMARLFREGLRGEPLKQTEIGEIPESWEVVPCEAICEMISVGIVVTPAKYYVPTGVPCFRSFNVQEDRLLENDFVFISEAANDLHGKSKLHTGDVIIVRTGYPGTACVVPEKYDGANCIDLIFARPNQQVVLSDYLARYINSAAGRRQVLFAQGGLAQQHFNVGALKRMAIALPCKEEQTAISWVGCLLDDKIAMAEAELSSLRALFSSMLHLLMTGQVGVNNLKVEKVGK